MRLSFAIVLLLAVGAWAADDPTASISGVIDLTPENFDKYVNGGKHALIEFYAPWCGHCKRLVPEYKKLGNAISSDPTLSSRVVIAKVDADKHRSLGERFGIQGFPTIKFFGRGKPVTENVAYEEGRTAERFLDFIKQKIQEDKSFARLNALDELAQKFMAAEDKDAVVAKAEEAAAALTGDDATNGNVYVELMKKAIQKGDEYLAKEKARVERVLASGSVHSSKVDQMSRKASVLSAFVDE